MRLIKIKETTSYNMICDGSTTNGNMQVDGDIRIDGVLNGDIECTGKIYLGYTGKIVGNIKCGLIEVQGEIKGDITSSEMTFLKSNCKFNGNVTSKKIAVEPGAVVNMNCKTEQ